MDVDCSGVDVNKESPAAAVSDLPEMSGASPPLATTEKPEIDEGPFI